MLNKKEFFSIITVTLVLAIIITLFESIKLFIEVALMLLVIILINISAKKIMSYYLDTEIEIKIWELKQFWYKKHYKFRNYVQAGIFIPLIIKFVSMMWINWMACLTFDASGKVYRAARKHGIYSFSEVTEEEMGWISGTGIIATLFFAIIAYLLGLESFSKLSLTYAFFNMIPIFDLDGAKIFFGNLTFWSFLSVISAIGLLSTMTF